MKFYRHIPIHLADGFEPCVHCGRRTSWRVGEDKHPCCPVCYQNKEPKIPLEQIPSR